MHAEEQISPRQPSSAHWLRKQLAQWIQASLLPLLILWTSFALYIDNNSFCLTRLPVLIGFVGMLVLAFPIAVLTTVGPRLLYAVIIAGLITFFVDTELHTIVQMDIYSLLATFLGFFVLFLKWQENVYRIAVTAFGTCLVSTLALAILIRGGTEISFSEKPAHASHTTLPRIVHLILDEHIGIEGIPTGIESGQAIKDKLLQFYRNYNFTLYGNAFSHYFHTSNAIPNALNFSATDRNGALVTGVRGPFKLRSNAYFKMLTEKHYQIKALGSGWLDFCGDKSVILESCGEYSGLALGAITSLDMPLSSQLRLMFAGYFQRSPRYQTIRTYYPSIRALLSSRGISLPLWTWDRVVFSPQPVNTMSILPDLWQEILTLPSGTVMFAHLLIPHFSYVYKADCSIHGSLQDMMNRTLTIDGGPRMNRVDNTPESREERYRLYFQQLECLYVRLDELFQRMQDSGIFEDSIIILHGDHGSRIGVHDPSFENLDIMSIEDYSDAFSTLFALKLPGKAGKYDLSVRPLEDLLAEALNVPLGSTLGLKVRESEPFVYLQSETREDLFRVFYPVTR